MVDFTDQEEQLAEMVPSEPARPKKITIVVVVSIILGALYVMGAVGTIPGLIMHVASPGGINFAPNTGDPQFEAQVEMQKQMQANLSDVTQTYFIPLVILALCSLAAGGFLLYTSIQVLRRGQLADYRLLNNTFIFVIVLVIANTIGTVMVQLANWHAMEDAFVIEGADPRQVEMFKTIMMFSIIAGMVLGVFFQLAKLFFFMIARWVLGHYIKTLNAS